MHVKVGTWYPHNLEPDKVPVGKSFLAFHSEHFSFFLISDFMKTFYLKRFGYYNGSEANIWLSLGGFQEKGNDEAQICNTHVLVDNTGNIRNSYRKIHL
jgi:hypothetical protein